MDVVLRWIEVGAANGTRGVRCQPGVDAGWVKHVAAFGDQAKGLLVLELAYAHRACQCARADLVALHGGVETSRECFDCLLAEANTLTVGSAIVKFVRYHGDIQPARLYAGWATGAVARVERDEG